MTKITFLATTPSQVKMFADVGQGLHKTHRIVSTIRSYYKKIDEDTVYACWGWRRGKLLQRISQNVLVFERGYLGDRFSWTSVGWNGLNGRADFCLGDVSDDRFKENHFMKPWKDTGNYIVIMGQVVGDASLDGRDLTIFYEDLAAKLKKYYDKPVYFRQHPVAQLKERGFHPRIPLLEGTMEDALNNAFLVVTFNSNSAVDAVVNGIPALSFDKGCMAYSVTGHDIRDRIFPDRTLWASRLAHCQWTPKELKAAAFWDRLKTKLEKRDNRIKAHG